MSVRSPFESLLQETARLKDWTFIAELSGKSGGAVIRPDGTLRDRKDPKIELEAKYKYSEPGKYTVVVKVIDILGNDTTKTLQIEVK